MINKKIKTGLLGIGLLGISLLTIGMWLADSTGDELPQILIDTGTNTIYVTGYDLGTWNTNTGSTNTWSTSVVDTGSIDTGSNETNLQETLDAQEEMTPEQEFSAALAWMHSNGLTMYDNEQDFRPQDILTREEASKIIWQAYSTLWYDDITKNASCTFSDSEMFNPTLAPHIANVCKRGLFKWSDGKFMPQDTLTKAQWMAVLIRMFEWKMSYELQIPWWSQYYDKWKIIWLTNVENINDFDHDLTRYEIALMIYRMKNLVENEQLRVMAMNAIWNLSPESNSWTMDSNTVIDNLGTLIWGIDPNTDPELLEAIYWMYDNGLTVYNNPAQYRPFDTLNRAGAAKIFDKFSNMLGLGVNEAYLPNECQFTDIWNVDSATQVHIQNVCRKWLIKWSNNKFSPDESIQKAQFVTALIRMFEWQHLDETTSPRRQNYFNEAQSLGLVTPSDAVNFENAISRYEVALFLYKFDIKYKMLNSLNNNRIANEVVSTVEGSISTWTNGKLEANVYVDANLLKDGDLDVGYIEIFGTRYKVVKTSEATYFSENFVRYGDLYDMVTDEKIWTSNFVLSNGYVIEGTVRFIDSNNYRISGVEWTSAYYKIVES